MRWTAMLLSCVILAGTAAAAPGGKEPSIIYDDSYGESLPQSTPEVALWRASSGWKVGRTRTAPAEKTDALEMAAARNEGEATQLVVRPTKALTGFTAAAGDLHGPDGAVIEADSIEVLRVRYVYVERQTDAAGAQEWWPDPLPSFKGPINIAAGENQPLWVRVYVPKGVPAGEYEGAIKLAADGYAAEVPLRLRVYDFELPDRMTCTSAFGFSPSTVWQYQKVTDPQQQREVLEKYWDSFRKHHISPYGPAPLDPFTLEWVKLTPEEASAYPEADRALLTEHAITARFDWSAWDAEMTRVFDTYAFNTIRLSILNLGGEFSGFPEGSRGYELAATSYYSQYEQHLRDMGFLDEGFMYWVDEPREPDYPDVMASFLRLKKYAPEIRRMLTEQVEPALVGGPTIWCPVTWAYDHEKTLERREAGDTFWWYVCTGPKTPFPGLFTDHPGVDLRVWLWQTWQHDIEGILIWASNLWTTEKAYPDHPQNPYEDPMAWKTDYGTQVGQKNPWGNGDGRFMYPPEAAADANPPEPVLDGPVDTIRWEMLRDGIEDYEYMVMLERLLEQNRDELSRRQQRKYARLLEVPEKITSDLRTYSKDPAHIEVHRQKLAETIEKLSAE